MKTIQVTQPSLSLICEIGVPSTFVTMKLHLRLDGLISDHIFACFCYANIQANALVLKYTFFCNNSHIALTITLMAEINVYHSDLELF